MKSILDKIVSYKKEELSTLKRKISLSDLKKKVADSEPARPFLSNFRKEQINIIAEIKKASPSAGVIRENFKPVDLAYQLEEAGAVALSILTNEHFFQGSLKNLTDVRSRVKLPCLRKDFTINEYHLFEARAATADAVLLIVSVLDDSQLKDFNDLSLELGMMPLVEIHSEGELIRALKINSKLVGVNNRDLATLKTDLQISRDLIKKIPDGIDKISESGFKSHDDLVKLRDAGYSGFLIGEALMSEKNPGEKLSELLNFPRP